MSLSLGNLSTADRPLAVSSRGDVQAVAVQFSGRSAYVLKDPLTLELFHLTDEEHFLFRSLKELTSLSCLRRGFERRFAPQRISNEALQHGINQLHRQGLVVSDAPAQGHELYEKGVRRQREQRWKNMLRLLSLRLGSVDATRIVDMLHALLFWIFSWPVLLTVLGLLGYAGSILLGQASEVATRLPSLAELAHPKYWLLWLATIAVVKVVHELAHAVTCQHFGGRCHEIGVLLLACMPCLYCDVTDVWRLPNKWQRIAVSAAGMLVELVIAAAALIAWWHTQPGLLHTWCLSVVIVCSVGTLLINANPLLRYDGYYILSDMIEVPNLAGRAHGLLTDALRRWLLGDQQVADPLLSPRQRRGLIFYAVAARLYLAFVILSIFVVLVAWAAPYRMENLVYTLGIVVLAGMIVQPVRTVSRLARNPSVRSRMRWLRVLILLSVIAALVWGVLYWPVERSVSGPVVFVPAQGRAVYASSGGELRSAVAAGTQVASGDIVAELADPESELALLVQEGECAVRSVRYQQLLTLRSWNKRAAAQLPTARASLSDAQAQLVELRSKAAQRTIKSLVAGVVVAPPAVVRSSEDQGRLPTWTGSPLDRRNIGCRIEPGTVLCTVSSKQELSALLAIDQSDVPEVRPGQAVRILPTSAPVRVLEGTVRQVARRGAARATTNPGLEAGKYHLIEVELKSQDPLLVVGARATAKIEASRDTLGSILANELRRLLRVPW